MDKHTATEMAYKNGYEQGCKDAIEGADLAGANFIKNIKIMAESGAKAAENLRAGIQAIENHVKEPQLRELAAFICPACEMGFGGGCAEGNDPAKCGISREVAEAIYKAGYRKSKEAQT